MVDLKVGVIGCGGHAQGHFAMIKDEPRMALISVAELDDQRLEQAKLTHEPESAFSDYREMLDQIDLDVVYVVTMPGHLLPIVVECLGRDLHTSVEKSPGMNVGETQQMLDAARKSKGKAIMSVNRRYKPEVLAVRKLLQERGGAVQVAANYHKPPSGLQVPGRKEVARRRLSAMRFTMSICSAGWRDAHRLKRQPPWRCTVIRGTASEEAHPATTPSSPLTTAVTEQ